MSISDILIGRPLANWEEHGEQVGPSAGIPIFGLDAFSASGREDHNMTAEIVGALLSAIIFILNKIGILKNMKKSNNKANLVQVNCSEKLPVWIASRQQTIQL